MDRQKIIVRTTVKAPLVKVWECWNKPEHITGWAFESDEWEVSAVKNDLRAGGEFKVVTTAKDKSSTIDYIATFAIVKDRQLIEYDLSNGQHVSVEFEEIPEGVRITETFDPENENPEEVQRSGWQATLDNFKAYAEGRA